MYRPPMISVRQPLPVAMGGHRAAGRPSGGNRCCSHSATQAPPRAQTPLGLGQSRLGNDMAKSRTSSTAGRGDPYWYEWFVGLIEVVELLDPTSNVERVAFQVEG